MTLKDDWFFNASAWYVAIGTKATFTTITLIGEVIGTVNDVDINPWVLMVGIGKRF